MCEGDLRPATLVRLPRDGRTTRHSGFAPAARSVATTRWWPPALAATSASLPPVDYSAPHVAKVREVHDHVADGTYVGVGTVTNKCSNRARMALRGARNNWSAIGSLLLPRSSHIADISFASFGCWCDEASPGPPLSTAASLTPALSASSQPSTWPPAPPLFLRAPGVAAEAVAEAPCMVCARRRSRRRAARARAAAALVDGLPSTPTPADAARTCAGFFWRWVVSPEAGPVRC